MRRIRIKHPGERGWAGIVPEAFDPARHELYDGPSVPPAIPASPDDIDGLGRAELRSLMREHGVSVPRTATVAELRTALKRVMFVDL